MITGFNQIFKCPNCGNLLSRGTLRSGNTIGAKLFSDGRRIAPMLPEFPDLTKCTRCHSMLWLHKLEETPPFHWENSEFVVVKADRALFPDIADYFSALEEGHFENAEEELYIRRRIWWAYNDRVRDGSDPFHSDQDETRWAENCKKLMALLKEDDLQERMVIAELKRNLGDFEGCLDIVHSIDNEKLQCWKVRLIMECEQRNKRVVQWS